MIMIHMCFQYLFFFTIAIVSAEPDVFTDIESCAYVDGSFIRCIWKKTENEVNYTLSYFMDSDTCVKQCYPTEEFISKSKKIYHQCSFSYPFLFTKFQFFLATNCSLKQEVDSCAKCKQKSKNIFKYETEQTSIVIESPPANFRNEKSPMTFEWDPPGYGSFLEYSISLRKIQYKLMYKLLHCQRDDSDRSKHEERKWKDLYIGEKSYYTADNLLPGCSYAARVHASFVDENWTKGSEIIRFQTPEAVYANLVNGNWSEDSNNSPLQPANVITFKSVVAACVCSLIIIIAVVALLACWICPEKFKVPKPVIMISSDMLTQDFNFENGNDDLNERESVSKLVISKEKCTSDVIFLTTPNGGRKIKNNYSSSTKLSQQYLPDVITEKRHSLCERNLKIKHLSFYDQLDSVEKNSQPEDYSKTDGTLHSRTDDVVIEIPKAAEKTATNYYRDFITFDHTLLSHSTAELRREEVIGINNNHKKWISCHSVSSEAYLSSDIKDSDYVPDEMKKHYPNEDYDEAQTKLSLHKEKLLDFLEKEEHIPEYVREFDVSSRICNDSHDFIVINIPTHEDEMDLYYRCAHIFNKSNSNQLAVPVESVI